MEKPELGGMVKIDVLTPLPSEGIVGSTYKIEGTVKMFDAVGAPPWVYAEVIRKEWTKPEIIEETHYERGFPIPITGEFSIGWRPTKEGIYEVTVVATPAPLSLPLIGVPPVIAKGDMMRVTVGKKVYEVKDLKIVSYGGVVPPGKLSVSPGESIKVSIEFSYMGPAWRETLYGALYKRTLGMIDEISGAWDSVDVSIPETPVWGIVSAELNIPVPERPSETVGIYAKLGGAVFSKYWDDVIEITEEVPPFPPPTPPLEPECRGLKIVDYDSEVFIDKDCRVNVEFEYKGPRINLRMDAAIGNANARFEKIRSEDKIIEAPKTETWHRYEAGVSILVVYPLDPADSPYDLYAGVDYCEPVILRDVIEVASIPLKPPEGETIGASDITHDSAIVRGKLIDTNFWSNVDVYFQWGKTTSYGKTTPKIRMYEGDEGKEFYTELLHYLEPSTTYHFRAVVEAVGFRSGEVEPGYGSDMTFTTEAEVVEGFTMRVINAPLGSVYWRAGCVLGGTYPHMKMQQPLDYVWEWPKSVPDKPLRFFVVASDESGITLQYDEAPFRLRVGKNYVWDFAAHEMRDNGVVWETPPPPEEVPPAPPGEYILTVRVEPSGAGRVTKEPDKTRYSYGEIVKLTAYPYSGYVFWYWDCDGEVLDTTNPINFMVMADHTLTAYFREVE